MAGWGTYFKEQKTEYYKGLKLMVEKGYDMENYVPNYSKVNNFLITIFNENRKEIVNFTNDKKRVIPQEDNVNSKKGYNLYINKKNKVDALIKAKKFIDSMGYKWIWVDGRGYLKNKL